MGLPESRSAGVFGKFCDRNKMQGIPGRMTRAALPRLLESRAALTRMRAPGMCTPIQALQQARAHTPMARRASTPTQTPQQTRGMSRAAARAPPPRAFSTHSEQVLATGERKKMNLVGAVNDALKIALEAHPSACIFGEDVGFGGVFRASADLQAQILKKSVP